MTPTRGAFSTPGVPQSPAWTYRGDFGSLGSPLVVAGDRLIGAGKGTVYALDSTPVVLGEGVQPVWQYQLQNFDGGDPQVTAAGGIVYLMDGDALIALRLADGTPLAGWEATALKQVSAMFAAAGRLIAMHIDATGATMVSGFDAVTAKRVFGPVNVRARTASHVAYGASAVFFVARDAEPAAKDDTLRAVNIGFGDVRWTFAGNGDPLNAGVAPIVASEVVLVPGGKLHAVDLITGQERWSVTTANGNATKWHSPVVEIPAAVAAATINANASTAPATPAVVAPSAAGAAVATNSADELVAVSLHDGAVRWRRSVPRPSAPSIVSGVVYVTIEGGSLLARFDLDTGSPIGAPIAIRSHRAQPGQTAQQPAVVTNGSLVIVEDDGTIMSRPFASQAAALFDGVSSRIQITPDGRQFDFGVADFTIESWFRSSSGGEIISGYPTSDVPHAHGFRFNLTPDGDLRFAVTNQGARSAVVGLAAFTGAADGEWHHVALVRRAGQFLVVLDGRSRALHFPPHQGTAPLSIGGKTGLTIGAAAASQDADPENYFRGLMREVRVWNCALDVPAIATNLLRELKGNEPSLVGLWRLNEVQRSHTPDAPPVPTVEPANVVTRHRARATFVGAGSYPTDLTMDESLFPYLLPESAPQWPYTGTWAVRGMLPVTSSAAVSSNGVVAFGTNNVIYAVDAHSGHRRWSMDVSESASAPVADDDGFLVLTEEESLIRLSATTGRKTPVDAFGGMLHDKGVVLAAPAATPVHIAAATGGGRVLVNVRGQPTAAEVTVNGRPSQLRFGSAGLAVLSEAGGGREITLIDHKAATPVIRGRATVTADVFCLVGDWVLGVKDGAVVKFSGGNMGTAITTSETLAGNITGLVASVNDDILIATTDTGEVHGLNLGRLATRWKTTLPVGPNGISGGRHLVNEPVLNAGERLICTTSSGTIAILDPDNGALLGRYGANRGAVGTPAFAAGTLFTGCTDTADPAADCDGAMHSVVVGETMVLRLNLDDLGAPAPIGQHAIIDAGTESSTLHLMGVHESCIEAWVNVPHLADTERARMVGGGIVGICPTTSSGFDVNLWLEPDGTLHYSSRAEDGTTWSGLHVKAHTSIVDGKWHHIAVSRSRPLPTAAPGATDRVVVYVDGVRVTSASTTTPAAPTGNLTGLKAFVGATAADDLTASRPFCGMIGEVRVWDTYVTSAEIEARMHVKLRGDEPDLLAYWNFDREAIHDGAIQGHDGTLAVTPTAPVWWLSDLPFHQPAYPYITTSAKMLAQESGKSTTYAATLKVCAADGSGIPNHEVHVWYVKHAADDPASILVNAHELAAVPSDAEAQPAAPGPGERPVAYVGTTANDGTLTLNVTTTVTAHGPALDVWTKFMTSDNERFHVNLLIDNQRLAKPPLPSLIGQSKLLQDYHYAPGDQIDHRKDRSTWRVVIAALNPDHSPRAREPITVWAEKETVIEVRGEAHTVNAENKVTLNAEDSGELTLVMSATDIKGPALFASAAFMHRNDMTVIRPDQDTHRALSKLAPEHLTDSRVTNWQKDPAARATSAAPMIRPEFHTRAPEISSAIRRVAAAVQPHRPQDGTTPLPRTPARARLAVLRGGLATDVVKGGTSRTMLAPALPAPMRQPVFVAPVDHVVMVRSVGGAARHAMVDVDAFHQAMEGHLGFVFEVHPETGVNLQLLRTKEEVAAARGHPTPTPHALGGILGWVEDRWNDVKDGLRKGGEFVVNGVRKVVVSMGEQLQLAITTIKDGVEKIVHKVAATVTDALNVIKDFFEQLLVDIMMVIAFLRGLFDWGAILKTHDILHDTFKATVDTAVDTLRDPSAFTTAISRLAATPRPEVPAGLPSANATRNEAGRDSLALAHARSVQGKSLTGRATSTPVQSRSPSNSQAGRTAPAEPAPVNRSPRNEDALQRLLGIAPGLLDLSPSDMLERLKSVGGEAAATLGPTVAAFMPTLADPLQWTADGLDANINIGFISTIYKWITGRSLTILDLFCLSVAVPVNLVYAAITLIVKGSPGEFWVDAGGLDTHIREGAAQARTQVAAPAPSVRAPMHRAFNAGLMADAAPTASTRFATGAQHVPGTPSDPEIAFMVIGTVVAGMDVIHDADFMMRLKAGGGFQPDDMDGVRWFQGIGGIVCLSLQTFASRPNFARRIRAVTGDQASAFLPDEWAAYLKYSLQMVLRANKLRQAVNSGSAATESGVFELSVASAVGMLAVAALIFDIEGMAVHRPMLAQYGNNNVKDEYTLLGVRDILNTSTLLYEWMYNKLGVVAVTKMAPTKVEAVYGGVTVIRSASRLSGLVLHGVAVFKFGD